MNKARRATIRQIISRLESQREDIESVLSDEQEAFDNLPEGLQCGERGEAMETTIDYLENASGNLSVVIEELGCSIE